jgi:hypothetical protein
VPLLSSRPGTNPAYFMFGFMRVFASRNHARSSRAACLA